MTNRKWHKLLWVGLRGLPADARQTWNAVRLNLDLTPPTLVITNATNLTVLATYYGPVTFPGLQGGAVAEDSDFAISNNCGVITQDAASDYSFSTTGGRSLQGAQSLFGMAANAVTIVPPVYNDAWQDSELNPNLTNISTPFQQVSIFGRPEGTDGKVWTSLPNGEVIKTSVRVNSPGLSSAPVTGADYPAQIYFNGTNVAGRTVATIPGTA